MFYIHAGPIAVNQSPSGKAVAEVLKPRAIADSLSGTWSAEADRPRQLGEGAPHGVGSERSAVLCGKESTGAMVYAEPIAASGILCQSLAGRVVDRYET